MPTSIPLTRAQTVSLPARELGPAIFIALPIVVLAITLLAAHQGGMSLAEFGLIAGEYAKTLM